MPAYAFSSALGDHLPPTTTGHQHVVHFYHHRFSAFPITLSIKVYVARSKNLYGLHYCAP